MKKSILLGILVLAVVLNGFSNELISLDGSNQYKTTVGFEMNEYDYLINPLYIHLLSSPWYFFGLDGDVTQLANNIIGDGMAAGMALGGAMTPVFLVNYSTTSYLSAAEEGEENISLSYDTYDQATGTYALVTESIEKNTKYSHIIHDLVLHGGLSLSENFALAFQDALAMDAYRINRVKYSNEYTNTAAPTDATLSAKGNRTDTSVHMRASSENSYKIDVEAGLDTGAFQSRMVLGAGWFYPGSGNNIFEEIETVYSGGLDPTVRDQENITTYTGQYYSSGSTVNPSQCFDMTGAFVTAAEYFAIGLQTDNTIPMDRGAYLFIPFNVQYDIYSPNLSLAENITTVTYNDGTADNPEDSRDETITTTNLTRNLDLSASTGAGLGKMVQPTEQTQLHFGTQLDFEFIGLNDIKTQQKVDHYQEDVNGDGDYADVGTDIDTVYTQSGYEVQRRELDYNFDLSVDVAVSYSPVAPLTFHTGATTSAGVDLQSLSTLTTGNSGFIYEQYTDNLEDANSYDQRQKDGTSTASSRSTSFGSDFDFYTNAFFGFTLEFSENFKLDARATAGDVGFEEFSVIGMYSR